jgi:hypothetical protein
MYHFRSPTILPLWLMCDSKQNLQKTFLNDDAAGWDFSLDACILPFASRKQHTMPAGCAFRARIIARRARTAGAMRGHHHYRLLRCHGVQYGCPSE